MSQLKEINGKYYQQCQVVMITDNKPAQEDDLILIKKLFGFNMVSTNTTSMAEDELRRENLLSTLNRIDDSQNGMWSTEGYHIRDLYDNGLIETQHLYFLSDDEIKEGDWFLCTYTNNISNKLSGFEKKECCKKIISTTDESLQIKIPNQTLPNGATLIDCTTGLPKPSDSFIKKYIEEYNVGKQIIKVFVEHDVREYKGHIATPLKVDSNNIITTKKVKDNYSREEVEEILLNHTSAMFDALSLKPYPKETLIEYTKKQIEKL